MNCNKILRATEANPFTSMPFKHEAEFAFLHFGLLPSLHLFCPALISVCSPPPLLRLLAVAEVLHLVAVS